MFAISSKNGSFGSYHLFVCGREAKLDSECRFSLLIQTNSITLPIINT